MRIFHQCGHNPVWNFDSYNYDNVGDGFILSPRYMNIDKVLKLSAEIKRHCIFDPQFFLPDTARGHLDSYDFFPEIASSGFSTSSYDEYAEVSAEKCVSFQLALNSEFIVIPTRFYDGTPDRFIDTQMELFIAPFLKKISETKTDKKILLQLLINDLMLKEEEFISDLLNWITGLDIDGIYLIPSNKFTTKQIKDTGFLFSILEIIHSIKRNQMYCVLGYVNLESILYSIADPDIVTMGSYENLRSFSLKAFEKKEGDSKQRGPNPRLYISQLIQLVESGYLDAIKLSYKDKSKIFDLNEYQAEMFKPTFNWHFSKPEIYKHFFKVFSDQLSELSKLEVNERFLFLKNLFSSSIEKHKELINKGIIFDGDSDGSHLNVWLTVLNIFATQKGMA